MSLSSASNVVSLSEYTKGRVIAPDTLREILSRCRLLAIQSLASSMAACHANLLTQLFDEAEKITQRERYNRYMNAKGLLEANQEAFLSAFRVSVLQSFDSSVRPAAREEASPAKPVLDLGELSLIDHAEFEQSLAVRQMAGLWRKYAADELNAYEARMTYLLGAKAALGDDAPFSALQVSEAVDSACSVLSPELPVRLLILERIAKSLATDLRQFYRALNAVLIEKEILPKVPLSLRVQTDSPAVKAMSGGEGASTSNESVVTPPAGMVLISEADASLLSVLRQLVKDGELPMALRGGGSSVVPALTQLQLTLPIHEVPSGAESVALSLRHLKEGALGEQISQVESLTIDIVAMLFDFIFDATDIPSDLKALIGRLQIPVLKAALLDSKFFSRKQHPVRRLLDLLAQMSVGWQSEAYQARLLALVSEVVGEILTSFTDDMAVFEAQESRLIAFQEEEAQSAARASARSEQAILFQEQQLLGREEARAWVADRLDRHGVPAVVRDFLAQHGATMLMHACQRFGLHSAAWYRAQEVMDQLIWSCEPKVTVEDRTRLVGLLQPMLSEIEQVLLLQPDGVAAKERFLAELVKCHAAAIRLGVNQLQVEGTPQIRVPVAALEIALPVLEEVIAEPFSPVDVPTHLPVLTVEETEQEKMDARWMQSSLRRGEWVEVVREDGVQQMKLAWISPHKGVYLFTNRFGGNALSIAQQDLSQYLSTGKVRRIDAGSFSERAVSNVLHRLEESAVVE